MNFDERKKNILKILASSTIAMKANVIHMVLLKVDEMATIVSVGRNLGLMSKCGWAVDLTGGIPGTPGSWMITNLGRAAINSPAEEPARGHAALVQEVKRLKDVIADSDAHHYKAYKTLRKQYETLEGKVNYLCGRNEQLDRELPGIRKLDGRINEVVHDLNETDQFARTHSHKSSLTTMTHEAKQGGAKQILFTL